MADLTTRTGQCTTGDRPAPQSRVIAPLMAGIRVPRGWPDGSRDRILGFILGGTQVHDAGDQLSVGTAEEVREFGRRGRTRRGHRRRRCLTAEFLGLSITRLLRSPSAVEDGVTRGPRIRRHADPWGRDPDVCRWPAEIPSTSEEQYQERQQDRSDRSNEAYSEPFCKKCSPTTTEIVWTKVPRGRL